MAWIIVVRVDVVLRVTPATHRRTGRDPKVRPSVLPPRLSCRLRRGNAACGSSSRRPRPATRS